MEQESKHILLGILSIGLPLLIGSLILWTDIRDTFMQKQSVDNPSVENSQEANDSNIYIYYKLGEEYEKVHIRSHKTFEYKNPSARICLSVNEDHYCLPLDKVSGFINKFGSQNISLTEHDENDNPSAGLNILEVPGFRY